jgi:hypothetical protein
MTSVGVCRASRVVEDFIGRGIPACAIRCCWCSRCCTARCRPSASSTSSAARPTSAAARPTSGRTARQAKIDKSAAKILPGGGLRRADMRVQFTRRRLGERYAAKKQTQKKSCQNAFAFHRNHPGEIRGSESRAFGASLIEP